MKFLVLLLAAWFVLATPSAAHADPITALVTAIASTIGSLGAFGQALFGLALKIGTSLLAKAMQKDPEPVGVRGQIQVGGDNPVSFIVGTYATEGQLEYVGTWGKSGKTPNAYLTQVISLSDLPVNGLVDLFVNGEKVTIDYDDTSYGDWGFPIKEYADGTDNALWIKFYDGTQTDADPLLIEEFGDHDERPWEAEMIGRGVAYAVVTGQFRRDRLTGPPRCVFVIEGIKVYDPRKDTTAGGSGPHRWGDRSTYEWSDNPKVIQYNVMRGIYYGGEWFYGGQGMRAFQLPVSSWFAAMNECDRLVDKKGGGTEKNFRCGYEVKGDLEPIELCQKLDRACNGKTAENGGIYKTVCGNPGMPVYYFTDENLIVSEPQSFTPFPGLEKTYNGAHASYPEPEEAWAAKDAPPRYRSDLEDEDDGRRLIANLTYEAVPYKRQVQRLMRAALEANRRFRSHQGVFTPAAKLLEPLDVISWTSARNGYENKRFQLGAIDDLNNVNQSAAFSELDPSDYDWSTDYELPDSTGPIGRVKPQPQVLTGFGVFPDTVKDANGNDRRPAILLVWPWDADDVAVRAIAFRVRRQDNQEMVFAGRFDQPEDGQVLIAPFSLVGNEDYEVRAKFITNGNTELFAWSTWLPVTTPDVQFIAEDILDGAITAQKIADAAITAAKLMDEAVTELKIADRAISDAKIKLDAIKTELIDNDAVVEAALADVAVTSAKIANSAVSELKLAANAVTEAKVAVGAITQLKIASGAVGNAQLAGLAVDAAKLATNAVTETKIADGAITTPKLVANAVVADKIAAGAITAGKILLSDLTNLVTNGSFTGGQGDGWSGSTFSVSPGSIRPPAIADWVGALPADAATQAAQFSLQVPCKPGDQYFVSADVASAGSGTYTQAQFGIIFYDADDVYLTALWLSQQLYTGWTTGSGTITAPANAAKLHRFQMQRIGGNDGPLYFTNVILRRMNGAEMIVDGAIIAGKIAALAVAAGNIQAGAITAGKIAADAVTAANIVAGTITSTELATNSVIAAKIAAGAVVAGKLAADSVTAANIVAGTVTATELASNSVTTIKIAAEAITGAKIAADSVTSDKLVANSITARELVLVDFENIIPNGFFGPTAGSGTLDGWTVRGGASIAVRPGTDRPPAPSPNIVRYPPTTTTDIMDTAAGIQCAAGDQFHAQFDCAGSGSSPAGTFQLVMFYSDADGNALGTSTLSHTINHVSWLTESGTFTAPAGAVSIRRIELRRAAGTTSDGSAYAANLLVRRKKNSELIVDGAIIADKLAVNSITVGALGNGAVTEAKLASNAVTQVKIANGAITANKISARVITADKLVLGDITYEEIGNNQITVAATSYTNSTTGISVNNSWSGVGSVTLAHGNTAGKVLIKGICTHDADIPKLEGDYPVVGMRLVDSNTGNVIETFSGIQPYGNCQVYSVWSPPSGRTSTTFNCQIRVETARTNTIQFNFRNRFVEATALRR
ncbi:phage tail protein [Rhizobium sp. TRM96647]|uniref:phage tail protein n=1 Tax=unclassified Rhizobium TaxID=2613769 RepID=UPI0021E7E69E|nr:MULTISPECIES: phage tail protein [unclassified Rhizobium]MCV3738390.1 phage tail protein [Rhizobium sp. TRM96647]MCV3759861.1 phage tail protein [Rhizobium sp. TRM96650]